MSRVFRLCFCYRFWWNVIRLNCSSNIRLLNSTPLRHCRFLGDLLRTVKSSELLVHSFSVLVSIPCFNMRSSSYSHMAICGLYNDIANLRIVTGTRLVSIANETILDIQWNSFTEPRFVMQVIIKHNPHFSNSEGLSFAALRLTKQRVKRQYFRFQIS